MTDAFNFDTDASLFNDTPFGTHSDPFTLFDANVAEDANQFSLGNDMADDYFASVTQDAPQVPTPMHNRSMDYFTTHIANAAPLVEQPARETVMTAPQEMKPEAMSQETPAVRSTTKKATTKSPSRASTQNKKRKRAAEPFPSSSSDDDNFVSSSRGAKRAKVDKPDLKDRERLAYLNSLPNLTEAQKVEKKKVYNRITARESRRRQKDLQKDSEKRISELEKENKKLKQKLAQVEKELKLYKSKTPHSPELNSEGGHSDSESDYSSAGMSLAALTVLLIAIVVLLVASATSNVGASLSSSKDIVPAHVQNTCAAPPLMHHSYPLLPAATHGSALALSTANINKKLLLPDTAPQTVYIPHMSRTPLSGVGVNLDGMPESLEKAYFYTTHDEEGKPTLYFYCPAIVPLLTDSSISQEKHDDASSQRIVFVYPKEVYQNEDDLGERVIELAQVEVEKLSNLEQEAYLILQNGMAAARGSSTTGAKIVSPAMKRKIIM